MYSDFLKKLNIQKRKTNTLYGSALIHKRSKKTATKRVRVGNNKQWSKITAITWILSNIAPCWDPDSAMKLLQMHPCSCLVIYQDTTWGMSLILFFRKLETVRTQYIIILPLIPVLYSFQKTSLLPICIHIFIKLFMCLGDVYHTTSKVGLCGGDNNKKILVFLKATEIQQQLFINHAILNLQRMLFNHIGDGALPRSDSNLPGPDKCEWKRCTIPVLEAMKI